MPSSSAKTPIVINHKPKIKRRLIIIALFLTAILTMAISFWWYISAFEQATGKTINYFFNTLVASRHHQILADENRTNILLLGLDEIRQFREGSLLTDTIIVISISDQGKILLLPLPRDLWINSLRTKINALYYYGELSDQTSGSQLTKTVVEEITGLPIHYTLIVNLETVKNVIDAIDGIEVNVAQYFIDTNYPRDDVDPSTTDTSQLYETIEFQAGNQIMDGTTALKFIRSRQSQSQSEGTDVARSRRQEQVITAIFNKIITPQVWLKPYCLGSLYSIWNQQVNTNLSDLDTLVLVNILAHSSLKIQSLQIPIYSQDNLGVLVHPPVYKYGQWVYEPIDPTWSELKKFVKTSLNNVK